MAQGTQAKEMWSVVVTDADGWTYSGTSSEVDVLDAIRDVLHRAGQEERGRKLDRTKEVRIETEFLG